MISQVRDAKLVEQIPSFARDGVDSRWAPISTIEAACGCRVISSAEDLLCWHLCQHIENRKLLVIRERQFE